ncbi:MAG: ABC transporter permease [Proteiniphilum sp.]|jgi:putative ABC transport system permease protein|nr:ABC transporter permease [Proteiniphilum sp.]
MNIVRSYKRTRFFLWVNITGLAIGLAISIMLILFVVNELSYDRHFANNNRIVRLATVLEDKDAVNHYTINLRKAYTELPEKIPGVEAAVQFHGGERQEAELIYNTERFQNLDLLYADPQFFKVFQMKFVEGDARTAFADPNSIVLTRCQAGIIFGGSHSAVNQTVKIGEQEYTVSAVVEKLPANTHFSFDALANMQSLNVLNQLQGLEFQTYYLIKSDAPLAVTRTAIEEEYTSIIKPFAEHFNGKAYGKTEKLTDIYFHSEANNFGFGKQSNIRFVMLLSGLALFILLLAVSNFINLFMAQGETRMKEIGIRKTNGASIGDIIRQFFSEVSGIVLIAFIMGFILTAIFTPYFCALINKQIDPAQLWNPLFILCAIGLFVVTVVCSAFYPALYLSRFSPLDILGKRLRFSKRRLTVVVVVFQSVITIVLVAFIMIIDRQTDFLKNIPIGYNPENVMSITLNNTIGKSYDAVKQELLSIPEIKQASGSHHLFGGGCSGQGISLPDNKEGQYSIYEYRIMAGMCELMEVELIEGAPFKENAPDSIRQIILNETAVKMLGLSLPATGEVVNYQGPAEIIGVVKDFYYDNPVNKIQPLVLSRVSTPVFLSIRFREGTDRRQAMEKTSEALRRFDPDFIINPVWSEDIYTEKFSAFTTISKVITIASLLSIFIALLGLVAIHLYTTIRRTKEIGVRRINGAGSRAIFALLTGDIVKWIAIAGVVAAPVIYYIGQNLLNEYANRISLDWTIFAFPVFFQCIAAILATSGVNLWALHQNPVNALKKE